MQYKGFKNRIIWITGSSKGIGKALSAELISEDCKLILSATSLDSFSHSNFVHNNIFLLPFDLTDEAEIQGAFNTLKLKDLYPDVLINNAGIGVFKNLKSLSIEDFDKMHQVNYRSAFQIVKSILPKMMENSFGVIANVLSVAAVSNFQRSSVYGASKAALLEMMKTLRMEVRSDGLKIINFLPGATETSIWSDKVRAEFAHKMMKPEELAKAIITTIDLSIINNLTFEEVIMRPTSGDL